jgi:hypothetical protein
MSRDTHRVMPHRDGWQVKRDGGARASHVTTTKVEAEGYARPISQHQYTELTIHGLNGRMQRSDSHPRP